MPKQLVSNQELTNLCLLHQKGDQKAISTLLRKIDPFVHGLVNRHTYNEFWHEDLCQEARKAIWEACGTFSPSRGRFITYVGKRASWAILKALGATHPLWGITEWKRHTQVKGRAKGEPTETPLVLDAHSEMGGTTPKDPGPKPDDLVHEAEIRALVWECLPKNGRQRSRIIRKFGLDGREPEDYKALGKSKQVAHADTKQGLLKMKRKLARKLGEEKFGDIHALI